MFEMNLEKFPRVPRQKKILILTTFHIDYMYALKKQIESRFAESVMVSIYDSNQLQLDLDYLEQFNILLTNYQHLPSKLGSRSIYVDIGISGECLERVKRKLDE